jgi:hypothetical protein
MRRLAWELILALVAVLAITAWYASMARSGLPQPGSLLGHLLGIVGFLLMLCTETVYTLRKRLRGFTTGSMRTWLQIHIFTGIVGPYLVLLHSGGKFHGLAGVLTLLTVVMVASGFVGRYIYTAAPRGLEGVELSMEELETRIADVDRRLHELGQAPVGAAPVFASPRVVQLFWMTVLLRPWIRWRQRRALRQTVKNLSLPDPTAAQRLEQLLDDRERLQLQIHCLVGARRLLALWHVFHVPLGAVLFTLAFMHIGAALYYATFLK